MSRKRLCSDLSTKQQSRFPTKARLLRSDHRVLADDPEHPHPPAPRAAVPRVVRLPLNQFGGLVHTHDVDPALVVALVAAAVAHPLLKTTDSASQPHGLSFLFMPSS
jgi:hypothetical protein